MLEYLVQHALSLILGSLVLGVISKLSALTKKIEGVKEQEKERRLQNDKDQELMKKIILISEGKSFLEDCSKYIQAGEIGYDEFKLLEERYSIYHQLGGNGIGTTNFTQCCSLPIKYPRIGRKQNDTV